MTSRTQHPGRILKERFMDPLGVNPYRLAKAIGVHVSRISKLVAGERSVTPDTATRLGLYFGVPARWWMEMQVSYDLDDQAMVRELRRIVTPLARPPGVAIGPDGVRQFRVAGPSEPPTTAQVSEALVERLRAQAKLAPANEVRKVTAVDYGRGYRAITGAEK